MKTRYYSRFAGRMAKRDRSKSTSTWKAKGAVKKIEAAIQERKKA